MARITIGMPVYQAERFLEEAVRSHLAQTFGDFEIRISDNGSTDRTESIARRLAAEDSRVRYERHETNRGAIWNLNHVAAGASGDFFKWSAHDDRLEPTFLERCVERLDADPNIALCFSRVRRIDAHGQEIPDRLLTDGERDGEGTGIGTSPSVTRRFRDVLLGGSWGIRSNGLIRVPFLARTMPLLPMFGSEKILVAELMLRGTYHEIDAPLFCQRIHAAQSSSLESAAEQQRFCDPRKQRPPRVPHLTFVRAYGRAISRAPIGAGDRLRCYGWLSRYVLRPEMWFDRLTRGLRGKPLGGGSRALLQRLADSDPVATDDGATDIAGPSNPNRRHVAVGSDVASSGTAASGSPVHGSGR
ncbi:MAG TPA: glycosyltransferase family 2 protein [Pirellulaceae bacterium]|nr:glycosyltransferase family 2 protein [Pirellulaceae bacterium]